MHQEARRKLPHELGELFLVMILSYNSLNMTISKPKTPRTQSGVGRSLKGVLSECTQLFHPWAHEPEGGWSGAGVPCRMLADPIKAQALWVKLDPVRSRQGTSGSHMVLYGSVYQLYTNTVQLNDATVFCLRQTHSM